MHVYHLCDPPCPVEIQRIVLLNLTHLKENFVHLFTLFPSIS